MRAPVGFFFLLSPKASLVTILVFTGKYTYIGLFSFNVIKGKLKAKLSESLNS